MTISKLTQLLICLLAFSLSASGFAAGYHVYDWKGEAKEKKGKSVRVSKWQPGYVLTVKGVRRVGKIMVTTVDGRIAEVDVKGDGNRKQTYVRKDLKEFGLLLSIADVEKQRGPVKTKFGPGTLKLDDGQQLQGILGAASLDDGVVFSISFAPDRDTYLTSYFSRAVKSAVMTIDGIEMEYLSDGGGFSKIPTLAEYRSFNHSDESRNPHPGSLLMSDGEIIEGQVLLFKDDDDSPALGAMAFDEDGFGIFWIASELARVTQIINGQAHYWTSYGSSLEPLQNLREYQSGSYRDTSRNAHPGNLILRDEQVLEGSVAFSKTKNDVYSIEVFYFDAEGIPYSYGGSDVLQVTQIIDGEAQIFIPYQDLVFVRLLAAGHPHRLHANPFPEREDQFKSALTRGLISALLQVGASQLEQEGINSSSFITTMGCEAGSGCSSQNTLRQAVESLVPGFKQDELIFRRTDQSEVVLIKKNFDDEIEPLLINCTDYAALSRQEKKRLMDFDHPGRAVVYLNDCSSATDKSPATPVAQAIQMDSGTVFQDTLKNGSEGPVMVVVPTGNYRMGDRTETHENEMPAHRIRFERPFAVSRFEITLKEYDLFTANTGRVQRTGKLSKQPLSPVRGIAWIDAVSYARWLSGQTGHHYRLPTEAEWEYVARAGTTTAYPWGDNISRQQVRCEACGDKKSRSADVGQFPENEFGLYDVVGGVWEWVADCWHPEYSGAPRDGSAWMDAGDCNLRVLRGGSIGDQPEQLRVGYRLPYSPLTRGSFVGFRLVRDF